MRMMMNLRSIGLGVLLVGAAVLGVVLYQHTLNGGADLSASGGSQKAVSERSDATESGDGDGEVGAVATAGREAVELETTAEAPSAAPEKPEYEYMSVELRPVDQAGRPVDLTRLGTDAYLNAWQEFEPGKWYAYEHRWVVQPTGLTLPWVLLGTYHFELRAGDGLHVNDASKPGLKHMAGDVFGSATSKRYVLDEAGGTLVVELPLRGSGVLNGRIETAEGEPVRGLQVLAVEAGAPFSGEAGQPLSPDAPTLDFQGQGLGVVRGVTDDEGRFGFAGLRPGPFHVFEASAKGLEVRERLSGAPLAADGREHVIVLEGESFAGLEVEVLAADGARVTKPVLWSAAGDATFPPMLNNNVRVWIEPEPWVDGALALDVEGNALGWEGAAGQGGGSASTSGGGKPAVADQAAFGGPPPIVGTVTPEGLVRFARLKPGAYRVLAASMQHALISKAITITAAGAPERVTLRMSAQSQTATLLIDLRTNSGGRLMGLTHVGLTERATGHRIAGEIVDSLMSSARPKFVVPAGEYWLDVSNFPTFDGPNGAVDERSLGASRVAVTLAPEATEELRVQLPNPARLEVYIDSVNPPANEAPSSQAASTDAALDQQTLVRIDLYRQGESPIPVWFYSDGSVTDFPNAPSAPDVFRAIPCNRSWLSEPLPAGRFEVLATLADGRTQRASIELVDGETSPLNLVMD